MSVLLVLCVVFGNVNAVLCCSEARQQARMTSSLVPDETALQVILDANGAAPPHWPAGCKLSTSQTNIGRAHKPDPAVLPAFHPGNCSRQKAQSFDTPRSPNLRLE